jgi:hypothetical protein
MSKELRKWQDNHCNDCTTTDQCCITPSGIIVGVGGVCCIVDNGKIVVCPYFPLQEC